MLGILTVLAIFWLMSFIGVDVDCLSSNVCIGETYEMRNDLVVRPFKTYHVIPSQVCLPQIVFKCI